MENNNQFFMMKNVKTDEAATKQIELFIEENSKNETASGQIRNDAFEKYIDHPPTLEGSPEVDDSDFEYDTTNKTFRNRTISGGSSGSSDADESLIDTLKKAPLLNLITDIMPYQPLPFGRRLSQCKEEEEEDDEKLSPPKAYIPTLTPIKSNRASQNVTTTVNRFIVTKASPQLSVHPKTKRLLEKMTVIQNAHTIHFPCSSPDTQPIQSLFVTKKQTSPHVAKQFFDTSLVEIRPLTEATSAKSVEDVNAPVQDDNVWIKRSPLKPKKVKNDVSTFANEKI